MAIWYNMTIWYVVGAITLVIWLDLLYGPLVNVSSARGIWRRPIELSINLAAAGVLWLAALLIYKMLA